MEDLVELLEIKTKKTLKNTNQDLSLGISRSSYKNHDTDYGRRLLGLYYHWTMESSGILQKLLNFF